MNSNRLRLAPACVSATAVTMFGAAPDALAGSNGQQVVARSYWPWVKVCGTNNYNH